MMGDVAKYLTCTNGHNVFVVRNHKANRFDFTCEHECSPGQIAVSVHGRVVVTLTRLVSLGKWPIFATCSEQHKVFVIWSDTYQRFGFTCETCDQHSERAFTSKGYIGLKVLEKIKQV